MNLANVREQLEDWHLQTSSPQVRASIERALTALDTPGSRLRQPHPLATEIRTWMSLEQDPGLKAGYQEVAADLERVH